MRVLLHVQEAAVPDYEMHVGYYTIIIALLCNFCAIILKNGISGRVQNLCFNLRCDFFVRKILVANKYVGIALATDA